MKLNNNLILKNKKSKENSNVYKNKVNRSPRQITTNFNARNISNEINFKLKNKSRSIDKNKIHNFEYKNSNLNNNKKSTTSNTNKNIINKQKNIKFKEYEGDGNYIKKYYLLTNNINKEIIVNRVSISFNKFIVNDKTFNISYFGIFENDNIKLLEVFKIYFHKLLFKNFSILYSDIKHNIKTIYYNIINFYNKNLSIIDINSNNFYNILETYIIKHKNNYNKIINNTINISITIHINNKIILVSNNNSKFIINSKNNNYLYLKNIIKNKNIILNKFKISKENKFLILKDAKSNNNIKTNELLNYLAEFIKNKQLNNSYSTQLNLEIINFCIIIIFYNN